MIIWIWTDFRPTFESYCIFDISKTEDGESLMFLGNDRTYIFDVEQFCHTFTRLRKAQFRVFSEKVVKPESEFIYYDAIKSNINFTCSNN